MQLASVVGREFTARVLDRMSDLEAQLFEVLGDLSELQLIFEKTRFPELAYMFKHALIHDVAYATLLADRRRALHRLAGGRHRRALSPTGWPSTTRRWPTTIPKARTGRRPSTTWARRATRRRPPTPNQDALEFYGRALDVCARLGEEAAPMSASLAGRRAFVNLTAGDLPGAISDFDRLLSTARRLGHRSLEGTALGLRGAMEALNNDWEQAEATLHTARAIVDEGFDEVRPVANLALAWLMFTSNRAPEAALLLLTAEEISALPDPFLEGQWSWTLGFSQYWLGRPREADETFRRMSEPASRIIANRLWNSWPHSLAMATMGDYEGALSLLETLQAICERVGDVFVLPRVFNSVGWIYGELEDHQRAMERNQASVDFVQGIPGFPNPDVEMHARLNLGDNLVALGRPDEGEVQFRIAEALTQSSRPADLWMAWRYSEHLFHSYGELWLARGDSERGLAYADQCLELALHNSSAKNVIKGHRLRGQVFMAEGRLKEADQELSSALDVALEVGNPPQRWKTLVAIGDLRRAQKRTEDAGRAYGEAVSVIEGVAASLTDAKLRETFVQSEHVQAIRRATEARS